jgi:hypothetical protein
MATLTAWATFGTASTGLITLSLAHRTLAAREFSVATKTLQASSSAADSAALGARLDGVVKNIDGEPIPDARVYVRGNRTIAKTYRVRRVFDGRTPGRHPGPGSDGRGVPTQSPDGGPQAGRGQRAEVVLGKTVQRLPTVEAVGKLGNDESSFLDRARRGFGYFITEDDIKKKGSITFEDIIRTVPGMQVVPVGQGYRIISSRGQADLLSNCAPQYFLDGSPFFVDISNGEPVPRQSNRDSRN